MATKRVSNAQLMDALAALTDKVAALSETAELRDRVARLEAQLERLTETVDTLQAGEGAGGGMRFGAVTAYSAEAEDDGTGVEDAGDLVRALGQQLTGAQNIDDDFVLDDIKVDLGAGVGARDGKAVLGVNAREGVKGGSSASRISFSLTRKVKPKVI